ncbi:DUF350 domain-containing protein [Magnetovibrio sp.]|uniref:DUF350 domain-containing protein n=1 Tax=Magnetovibrio sp. TaxID=2024836 RepID=UPI002F93F9A1
MEHIWQTIQVGFPVLLVHLGLTLGLFIFGVFVYVKVTPHHEFKLVRENNAAAGLSLAGVVIGMAMPLAFSLAASVNELDILLWGLIVVVLQLVAFAAAHVVLRDLSTRIENGEMGAAWVLLSFNMALAMFLSAAISG